MKKEKTRKTLLKKLERIITGDYEYPIILRIRIDRDFAEKAPVKILKKIINGELDKLKDKADVLAQDAKKYLGTNK